MPIFPIQKNGKTIRVQADTLEDAIEFITPKEKKEKVDIKKMAVELVKQFLPKAPKSLEGIASAQAAGSLRSASGLIGAYAKTPTGKQYKSIGDVASIAANQIEPSYIQTGEENPAIKRVIERAGQTGNVDMLSAAGATAIDIAERMSARGLSGVMPTQEQVIEKARQTGQVSKLEAAKAVAGEMDLFPTNPVDAAVFIGIGKVLGIAAQEAVDAFPILGKSLKNVVVDWAKQRRVKTRAIIPTGLTRAETIAKTIPRELNITKDDIREFFIFGKERLSKPKFDVLSTMSKDDLVELLKSAAIEASKKPFSPPPPSEIKPAMKPKPAPVEPVAPETPGNVPSQPPATNVLRSQPPIRMIPGAKQITGTPFEIPGQPKMITEQQALKRSLTRQSQVARETEYKTEQKLAELKNNLTDTILQTLPETEAGRFLKSIANVKTESQALKIIDRLEIAADRVAKMGPRQFREADLAKRVFNAERKVARETRAETIREINGIKKELVNIVKQKIPYDKQGKYLSRLANVKTRKGLRMAIDNINEYADTIAQNKAIKELISAKDSIGPLKFMRQEYAEKIKPFYDAIDFKTPTTKKLKELEGIADFIESNPDNSIPPNKLNELRRLSKKPIKEFDTEEINLIKDHILHFKKLNDLKNKIIVEGKLKKQNDIVNEAVNNISIRHENANGSIQGLDTMQVVSEPGIIRKIGAAESYNVELISRILDGVDDGVIEKVLYEAIDKGTSKQIKIEHDAMDFMRQVAKNAGIADNWSKYMEPKVKNLDIQDIELPSGKTIRLTRGERMSIYLHSLRDASIRHLLEGGLSLEDRPFAIQKITEEDLSAIIDSMTDEEIYLAKNMSEYINGPIKDIVNKAYVDLNGYPIARESNYWPIRTNELDRNVQELIKGGKFGEKTLEGMGIFKQTQNAANALIVEDAFSTFYKHIRKTAAYAGLAEPIRNARALLYNNDFRSAMMRHGLQHYIDPIKSYLTDIETTSVQFRGIDRLTQEAINKLDVGILGLNPFVMLKQFPSLVLATTEFPNQAKAYLYMTKAILRGPITSAEVGIMSKLHPQLRDRFTGNVTREMGEVAEVGRVRNFFTGKHVISQYAMKGISSVDTQAIGMIFRMVRMYMEDASGGNPVSPEQVADQAWKVIRRTQPTFHLKDRSKIGRTRQIGIRLATKYFSQRNKNWMIARRAVERYNSSNKTSADKARLLGSLTSLLGISAAMIAGIDELRGVAYARKNGDKEISIPSKILDFAQSMFETGIGSIYFVGPFVSQTLNALKRKLKTGRGNVEFSNPLNSAVTMAGEALVGIVTSIAYAIEGDKIKLNSLGKTDERWEKELKRTIPKIFDLIGLMSGINIATIRKLTMGTLRNTGIIEEEKKIKKPAQIKAGFKRSLIGR